MKLGDNFILKIKVAIIVLLFQLRNLINYIKKYLLQDYRQNVSFNMIKNYIDMVGYIEYSEVFIIQLGKTFFYT